MNTKVDEPALVELWTSHSDWGSITAAEWEHKFLEAPQGPASFVLAVEDDTQEIVAQFAYLPCPMVVDGRQVQGRRPYAVIVSEGFRAKSGFLKMQQMIISMYTMAADSFAKQGVGLLYMLPDPRWSRIIKMMPFFQSATFPLWSHPLPLRSAGKLPAGHSVAPLEADDARIDALWQQASRLYPCMVARDARTLAWKISHDPYQLRGVFRQHELVGLFAFINRRKDNQWLIADVLSANAQGALDATLLAACLVIDELNAKLPDEERTAYRKIAVLSTPPMVAVLQKLQFVRDNYDFLLVVHALDSELAKVIAAPQRWYVSAND